MLPPRFRFFRGTARLVLAGLLALVAARAEAEPTLTVTTRQEARRPRSFTGIPVWEPVWWAVLKAKPDQSPLTRVEYRGGFHQGELRPVSGGWDVPAVERDGFDGRIRVSCDTLAAYDEQVRLRFRVVDAAGEASRWMSVEFPPVDEERAPEAAEAPTAAPGKSVGTVSYLGGDEISIADARRELERQARAQGGAGITDLKVDPQADGRTRFTATVVEAAPKVVPTPKAPMLARGHERTLGEIQLRTQPW